MAKNTEPDSHQTHCALPQTITVQDSLEFLSQRGLSLRVPWEVGEVPPRTPDEFLSPQSGNPAGSEQDPSPGLWIQVPKPTPRPPAPGLDPQHLENWGCLSPNPCFQMPQTLTTCMAQGAQESRP
ncbi:hypothetical protein P7K49_012182 [Saguinus oedipus]|uniref:Uncharacterized protein n=1 Tax=Saguinus oedipus TaxID=9490 RepID=A0ABQ9VTD1_SAGOE|nr:hypothetical protein P7K49_012182 [Saguinus oedipus]